MFLSFINYIISNSTLAQHANYSAQPRELDTVRPFECQTQGGIAPGPPEIDASEQNHYPKMLHSFCNNLIILLNQLWK